MPAPEHIRSRRRGLGRDTRRSAASRGCDASLAPGCRSARVDGSTAPRLVHPVARAAVKRSGAGTTGTPPPPPVIEAAPAPTNDLVDAAIDGLGAYQEAQRRALAFCAASGGFAAFLLEYLSLPFNNNSHANTLSLSFYQCRGPSTRLLVARRVRLVVVRGGRRRAPLWSWRTRKRRQCLGLRAALLARLKLEPCSIGSHLRARQPRRSWRRTDFLLARGRSPAGVRCISGAGGRALQHSYFSL